MERCATGRPGRGPPFEVDDSVRGALLADPGVDRLALGLEVWRDAGEVADRTHSVVAGNRDLGVTHPIAEEQDHITGAGRNDALADRLRLVALRSARPAVRCQISDPMRVSGFSFGPRDWSPPHATAAITTAILRTEKGRRTPFTAVILGDAAKLILAAQVRSGGGWFNWASPTSQPERMLNR
jgi:hypothetical protein